MNEYEQRRLAKIEQNQALLAELDIKPLEPTRSKKAQVNRPPAKRRKLLQETAPARTSARIASAPSRPSYNDGPSIKTVSLPQSRQSVKGRTKVKQEGAQEQGDTQESESIVPWKDVDEIRAGWESWTRVATPPTRDSTNAFHFETHPDFTPNKSPEEVIREGCFGGSYYRALRSRKLGIVVEDDWKELPAEWTAGLSVDRFLTSPHYNPDVNKYKVSCGQSIEQWEAAGWISHEHDVRGWFQWYTRFFQGRRCDDDDRQVSRWKKCVGETGRWRRMLLKKYMALGVREVFDDGEDDETPEVSPVMHQTCHHWAFEVRQNVLDEYWASGAR